MAEGSIDEEVVIQIGKYSSTAVNSNHVDSENGVHKNDDAPDIVNETVSSNNGNSVNENGIEDNNMNTIIADNIDPVLSIEKKLSI